MALKWRKDSVAELRKQKSKKELQAENEALQQKVTSLEAQMTSTQVALCEVYEQILAASEEGV
ncbi:hypothetical protein [Flavonifractor plautii]|jgi:chaperonin cofactor prefoldin|uniref:hypothetical protein n=1 Tax=Flavonifractor plautii TaxID=292800 RepID=UPI00189A178C|nr:hypothetical protein [Flavonifractor plautii]